jgi:hypothetical protein
MRHDNKSFGEVTCGINSRHGNCFQLSKSRLLKCLAYISPYAERSADILVRLGMIPQIWRPRKWKIMQTIHHVEANVNRIVKREPRNARL